MHRSGSGLPLFLCLGAVTLVSACGDGGGTSPTNVAAPSPSPPRAAEQSPPSEPPIEITPVGRGISVTSENQILLELMSEDLVPANPLDLAGRTLVFTPDGDGGYSRSVRVVDWEDNIGNPVGDNEEIEPSFRLAFADQEWESFFVSRYGAVTYGEPYPFPQVGPDRWGTMVEIAGRLGTPPMIAALYKPRLGGWSGHDAEEFGNVQHVSRRPDRVVITWITSDPAFYVHGVPPREKTRFQMALYADGRIAFHYAPEPKNPDEALRDGIVGLFPGVVRTDRLLKSIADPEDRSLPGHLDLVETAVYTTSEPNRVLVEFTTRSPIRPLPGQELVYELQLDVDEPFTDEHEDRDLLMGAVVLPDGRLEARWDATGAPFKGHENRIALLAHLQTIGARSASVSGRSWTVNSATGAWSFGDGGRPDVVMFPEVAPSAPTDLSRPGSSPAHREVFHHTGAKDHLVPIGCRVIELLGNEFDALVFHSQFRYDLQFSGSWWGFYPGNTPIRGIGHTEEELEEKSPCATRLRGQWGFAIWTKSDFVAVVDSLGRVAPSGRGLWHIAHEFTHTWTARASYLNNGESEPLWTTGRGAHWLPAFHTPAAFARSHSIMGGRHWRENEDGTFTPVWPDKRAGEGLSWLDLYLAGLATPDEVPDSFILRNLRETGAGWLGPHTGEKETVTMEQILAALGPRDPPAARSQKVFNIGFVYLLEPGQQPDQDDLSFHALLLDEWPEYWARITGGRSRFTIELPGRQE